MNPEISIEVLTIIGTGIMLAVAILPGMRAMQKELSSVRERMSGIEGFLTGRKQAADEHAMVELKSQIAEAVKSSRR